MRTRSALFAPWAVLTMLVVTACGPQGGDGSDFPSQNVELLVGFAAGGHNDATARKFAEGLEVELDANVLVVNREGGGGAIAATEAANAAADGHTLLFAPTGAFTSVLLQQDVSYGIEDFRSVEAVAENAFVIVVPDDSPIESFEDLEDVDDRMTYSAFGEGHQTHLIGEGIVQGYGLDAEVATFPGGAPALPALVNGDVDWGVQDITSALPRVRSGELRILAISTDYLPDALDEEVPTLGELGFEELQTAGSQALVVPADTPQEVYDVLAAASTAVIESDEFVEFVEQSGGAVPDVEGEAWFSEYMPTELERFRSLFEDLGLEVP